MLPNINIEKIVKPRGADSKHEDLISRVKTAGSRIDKAMTPQGADIKHEDMLSRVKTAGSVTITPEVFEQMFLAPQTKVKGELRQTFGNPTPLALGGFLLTATPLSMVLLGWQGAGGLGAANVGTYFYLGGLLLLLGGIGEWLLGNTFPAVVFMTFAGFWFVFGSTLVPFYNAYGFYATEANNLASGLNAEFYATFAFFLVAMLILCAIFCVASVRTNICFFLIFLTLIPTFGALAGSFFALSHGETAHALILQHVGAGLLLAVTLIGWYIFTALMLLSVDFPIILPLGDLSTHIKGYTDIQKAKMEGKKD